MAPRALPALALLAVLLAAAAAPSSAAAPVYDYVYKFVAVLDGKHSSPPDHKGKGISTVELDAVGGTFSICRWTVTLQNLTDGSFPKKKKASGVVAMHIHRRSDNYIVFWLGTPLGDPNLGLGYEPFQGSPNNETLDFVGTTRQGQALYEGQSTFSSAVDSCVDVYHSPSDFYVDVHTLPHHPKGAVRGQLYPMKDTAMAPSPAIASSPMMKGALGLASWHSAAAAMFSAVAAALVL